MCAVLKGIGDAREAGIEALHGVQYGVMNMVESSRKFEDINVLHHLERIEKSLDKRVHDATIRVGDLKRSVTVGVEKMKGGVLKVPSLQKSRCVSIQDSPYLPHAYHMVAA